jgi:hypothetical protein
MKTFKLFIIIGLISTSITGVFAVSKTITNPQVMMVGARSISLGLNPALHGDISHSILNPATNSDINQLPFSITSQQLLQEFNYLVISTGMPTVLKFNRKGKDYRSELGLSFSYSNLSLSNIPETVDVDGFPYQIGTFSAGYHLVHFGLGTNLYERLTIDKIATGLGLKSLSYYVGSDISSTIGVDFGLIATQYIDYKFISSLDVGVVLQNALSPGMTISKTNNQILLPFSIILGGKVNLVNDRLSLLTSVNDLGLSLGSEFEVDEGVFVRASTNQKDLKLGLGVILDNLPTGLTNYTFKGRFDFNYTQAAFPMDNDPTYVFTFSSLGRSIPKKPQILSPKKPLQLISEKFINLSGVGPKNTVIRIYNNDKFIKSVVSNKFGGWSMNNFLLEEGENKLYVKAYDLDKDLSFNSNEVTVISDTSPPQLDISLYPDNSVLVIEIKSNEKLNNISAEVNEKKVRLREEDIKISNEQVLYSSPMENTTTESYSDKIYLKPTLYKGKIELPVLQSQNIGGRLNAPPQEMNEIEVLATDESGNSMQLGPLSFFGTITYPVDKHVHYSQSLTVIGNSSDLIENIYVNKERVGYDEENRFSSVIDLSPGKNLLETTFETQNNKSLTYHSRVLRLVTYPDMDSKVKGRREIEFLSTLDVLYGDSDGNFYPLKNVTRQYITKLMVLSLKKEETLAEVENNLFADVSFDHPYATYIQEGVNEGLVYGFPDGTFQPEQEITLTEVIFLLSNSGIIDYEEVDDSDRLITRAELAEFLAYTARFERKIEQLINWEDGYTNK